MSLPSEWWQHRSVAEELAHWFVRHVLGLALSFRYQGNTRRAVFTGFLVDLRGRLLWMTAGHIIEQLNRVLSSSDYSVLDMRWLDRWRIPGAESLPAHRRNLRMYSGQAFGADFGMVIVSGLDEAHLRSGREVAIVGEQAWRNLHLAKPEGFYVIGFPWEMINIEEETLSNGRTRVALDAQTICLPVRRLEHPGTQCTGDFWDDPEALYGQILPFVEGMDGQPNDIEGMSGGPVFSLERDASGSIRYRLFGVQAFWEKNKRLIRAEPIQRVVERAEQWVGGADR